MIVVQWSGKAVSVNRWHGLRYVWGKDKTGRPTQRARISPTREYEEFVQELSIAIMAVARRHQMINLPRVSICMSWRIGSRMDDQNLLKPVCDAIERAGVVKNDRYIGVKLMVPVKRHNGRQPDELFLAIAPEPEIGETTVTRQNELFEREGMLGAGAVPAIVDRLAQKVRAR